MLFFCELVCEVGCVFRIVLILDLSYVLRVSEILLSTTCFIFHLIYREMQKH